MKRRIPPSYFIIGFISNLVKYIPLLVIALILLVAGIFVKPCGTAGGIIAGICVVLALAEQTVISGNIISSSGQNDPRVDEILDAVYGIPEDGAEKPDIDDIVKKMSGSCDDETDEQV